MVTYAARTSLQLELVAYQREMTACLCFTVSSCCLLVSVR